MTDNMERRMLRAWNDLMACLRDLAPSDRRAMLSVYQHLLREYENLSGKDHKHVPHTKST